MYSEWASLSSLIQQGSEDSQSVLEKFSPGVGREVALSIVRQLAANLGIAQAAEPSSLNNDREIQWCMEVICYGLSLPLNEHDTVRDCVNVYCEWLSALYSSPKISVPRPIIEDSNFYARKIISHFHNLFVPRRGEGKKEINYLITKKNYYYSIYLKINLLYFSGKLHFYFKYTFSRSLAIFVSGFR